MVSQLDELTATYTQLCDSSAEQLQQLEEQQAKEEKRKVELEGQEKVSSDSGVRLCQSELQQQKACLEMLLCLRYGQVLSMC